MATATPTSPVQYQPMGGMKGSMFFSGQALSPEQQLQLEELNRLKEEQAKLSFLLAEVQALPMPRSASVSMTVRTPTTPKESDAVSVVTSAAGDSDSPDESWTVEMVGEWVRQKGASEEIVKSFIEQDIDGSVLATLSAEDLKSELGVISFGLRRKLMMAIEKLNGKK